MSECTDPNGDKWLIYQSNGWRWRRTSSNGNIVGASSESYVSKQNCIDNAKRNGMKCNPL